MIEMSNCPNCATVYEKGDKFCQDCGLPLADAKAVKAAKRPKANHDAGDFDSLFSKTGPLNLLQLNKAPAELILLAAAVAYIASAVIWTYHDQIGRLFTHGKGNHATKYGARPQMGPAKPSAPKIELKVEPKIAPKAVEPALKAAPIKVRTNPEEIKDVAEYNRLLADYFSRHQADPQAVEPPSFPEWIASKKHSF
jgi:hypothetical protein